MFKIQIVAVWHQAVTKLKLRNCPRFLSSEVKCNTYREALQAAHLPKERLQQTTTQPKLVPAFYSVELTVVAKPQNFADGAIPAGYVVLTACYSQQDLPICQYCFAYNFAAKWWIIFFFHTKCNTARVTTLLLKLFCNSFRKTTNNVLSVTILDLRSSVKPLHSSYSKIRSCCWAWAE